MSHYTLIMHGIVSSDDVRLTYRWGEIPWSISECPCCKGPIEIYKPEYFCHNMESTGYNEVRVDQYLPEGRAWRCKGCESQGFYSKTGLPSFDKGIGVISELKRETPDDEFYAPIGWHVVDKREE